MVIGGGAVFLGFFVLSIAALAAGIYTCIDASKYPDWAFERTGTNKALWQFLPIAFILFCGLGALVMAVMWIGGKRDAVARAAAAAPSYGTGYPYGAPPPGWGPPPAPGWTAPSAPPPSAPPPSAPPPSAPAPFPPPEPPPERSQ